MKQLEVVVTAKDEASKIFGPIAQNAQKASNAADNAQDKTTDNFFSRLAKKAKAIRLQRRKTGETALSQMFSSGKGITQGSLDALGLGVQGLVLDQVGQALDNLTASLVKMSTALRTGKANWADLSQNALESLPIIGHFAKAGHNLNELFFHTEEKNADIKQQATVGDMATDFMKKRLELQKRLAREFGHEKIEIQARLELAGKQGFEAEVQRALIETQKQVQDAREKKEDRLKALKDEQFEQVTALQKQYDEATSDETRQQINDKKAQLEKDSVAKTKEIEQDGANQIAGIMQAADAEEIARERIHLEQMQRIFLQYAEQRIESVQNTEQTLLKLNRNFLDAEITQIIEQTEAKKRAADAELKERIKGENYAVQQRLIAENNATKQQLDNEALIQRRALERNAVQDASIQLAHMAGDAGNQQAKAQAELLQQLRSEYDLREKLLTVANDDLAGYEDRKAAQQQLASLEEIDKERVANNLKNVTTSALKAQAQFGETASQREAAKRDLEKQKLKDAAIEQAAEVNKILSDPKASKAQKDAAIQEAKDFAQTTARQYQEAIYGSANSQSVFAGPDITHGGDTGLALRAQEKDDRINQQLTVSKQSLEVARQTYEFMRSVLGNNYLVPTGGR